MVCDQTMNGKSNCLLNVKKKEIVWQRNGSVFNLKSPRNKMWISHVHKVPTYTTYTQVQWKTSEEEMQKKKCIFHVYGANSYSIFQWKLNRTVYAQFFVLTFGSEKQKRCDVAHSLQPHVFCAESVVFFLFEIRTLARSEC